MDPDPLQPRVRPSSRARARTRRTGTSGQAVTSDAPARVQCSGQTALLRRPELARCAVTAEPSLDDLDACARMRDARDGRPVMTHANLLGESDALERRVVVRDHNLKVLTVRRNKPFDPPIEHV